MRRIIISVLAFFAATSMSVWGQSNPQKIKMYLDFARFRYDNTSTYLEIYYLIGSNNPQLASEEKKVKLDIRVKDETSGKILASKPLVVDLNGAGGEDTQFAKLGLIKSVLPEGHYKLILRRFDSRSGQPVDSVYYTLSTAGFGGDKVTMSDLELCTNIIPRSSRQKAVFYKNTMEAIPNPTRMYGKNNPRLYYYVELYNVKVEHPHKKLQIDVAVADQNGKIRSERKYARSRKYESLVEKGAFNVGRLESGLYTVVFAVTDSINKYSVYRRSNFFVNNPDIVATPEQDDLDEEFKRSKYYEMDVSMVDELFHQASYIATDQEKNIFKTLTTPETKRKFLFNFWWRRDKEHPNFSEEYQQRVRYANKNFRSSGVPGWETDRGRVYIVYGKPDQVDKNYSSGNENPFQVWFYQNLEGGTEFDFVDLNGYGDYRLVNSNYRTEIHDPNWKNYIYQR